jgi:hypothetical protein
LVEVIKDLEMRSPWSIQQAPSPMTCPCKRKAEGDLRHTEGESVWRKAETGARWPQAKECQQGRSQQELSLRAFRVCVA